MNVLFGAAATAVTLAAAMHPVAALADGPVSAYDNGGVRDPSLDPDEERMTADEENEARLRDLSDAYHNGYTARAKEDADVYSRLREQVRPKRQLAAATVPPLPPGYPGSGGVVPPVAALPVAQRPIEESGYQWQVTSAPPPTQPYAQQYAPPPYPAQAYAAAPPDYAPVYAQPVYAQPVYEPPPPPVEYIPAAPAYVAAPIVTAAALLAGFRGYGGGWRGYRGGGWRWH